MFSRVRTFVPLLALSLAACASRVVYVQVPTGTTPEAQPAPVVQPAPVPEPIDPLEVTIGRPLRGRFTIHTNRPAYVAVFEVVPEQGITLIRPSSVRERDFVVYGTSSLRAWWQAPAQPEYGRDHAVPRTPPTRYIYAVASDEPLHMPDAAFRQDYLYRTLGARTYYAAQPYGSMRALARHFVPDVTDEEWGEDVLVVAPATTQPQRVARVYCPDGRRYEVPLEMADRITCPRDNRADSDRPGNGVGRGRPGDGKGPPVSRGRPVDVGVINPDSVVSDDNRRVNPKRRGRGPIDRVAEPVVATGRGPQADGNNGRGPDANGSNGRAPDRVATPTPRADSAAAPMPMTRVPGMRRRLPLPTPTRPAVTSADQETTREPEKRVAPADPKREAAAEPEAAKPEQAKPDTVKRDSAKPDSVKQKAETPDESRKPDSSSAKPNATKGKPQVRPGPQG